MRPGHSLHQALHQALRPAELTREPGPATPFLPPGSFVGLRIAELLDEAACARLVAALTAAGFAATGAAYPDGYRNNDRLVLDDAGFADALYTRARARLPAELSIDGERWEVTGLNPRLRACRYQGGQRFCVHRDGPYVPGDDERSFLTLQIYLNDGAALTGGNTRFYAGPDGRERWADLVPRTGSAIVFDHRAWHDGEAVTRGCKIVLRTDVLYRRAARPDTGAAPEVLGRHRGYVWRILARDDGTVVSSGRDGTVRTYRPDGPGFRESAVCALGDGSVLSLAEGAAAEILCGTRRGGLYAVRDGEARRLHTLPGAVLDLARAPGGALFAALSTGAVACLSPDGTPRWERPVLTGWAWSLCARPDGVYVCGDDGRVVALDPGGAARTVASGLPSLRALAALPDGQLLAGDAAGALHVVTATGERTQTLPAHTAAVTALATGPCGWVSAGEDGRVLRWRDGRPVASWQAPDFVRTVALRPGGYGDTGDGTVLWGGYDGRVSAAPLTQET